MCFTNWKFVINNKNVLIFTLKSKEFRFYQTTKISKLSLPKVKKKPSSIKIDFLSLFAKNFKDDAKNKKSEKQQNISNVR